MLAAAMLAPSAQSAPPPPSADDIVVVAERMRRFKITIRRDREDAAGGISFDGLRTNG